MVPAAPTISNLLDAADRIGLFPAAAFEVFNALKDPDMDGRRLAAVMTRDPVLCGRILKTANSPFYGRQRRVGTISEALVVLGFPVVRDLAVSFALVGMSKTASPESTGLWKHMLSTGVFATGLTRHVRTVDPAAALVVGTMHDIGELIMLEVEPKRHAMVLTRLGRDDPRVVTAERIIFGIDHAELGAACVLEWGLPTGYAAIVREHHGDPAPGDLLGAVIRLADAGVGLLEGGVQVQAAAMELSEHAANRAIGLSPAVLQGAMQRVKPELAVLQATGDRHAARG